MKKVEVPSSGNIREHSVNRLLQMVLDDKLSGVIYVFRTRDSADRVAQDWPRWLREGLVDYAIPMSYVATAAELKEHFAWWKTFDPKLERTIPAVGAFRIGVDLPPADRGFVMFVLAKIDDETAAALGRTALKGKARPYAPGQQGGRRPLR